MGESGACAFALDLDFCLAFGACGGELASSTNAVAARGFARFTQFRVWPFRSRHRIHCARSHKFCVLDLCFGINNLITILGTSSGVTINFGEQNACNRIPMDSSGVKLMVPFTGLQDTEGCKDPLISRIGTQSTSNEVH